MREKEMQKIMQQDLAVPQRVHDSFEQGLEQIYQMDTEQERIEEGIEWKVDRRNTRLFWRKAGVAATAAIAVFVCAFHSQIYSFAKSLFIRTSITVGKEKVQETDMRIVKIKDGVLTDDFEPHFFESMEDLGEKLGVSFLKSSMENTVTGKGRIRAVMHEWGEVSTDDFLFCVKDISQIKYLEDGETTSHMDSKDAYSISCETTFFTKAFQDEYGEDYDDTEVIEDYKTKNGFSATVFRFNPEKSGYNLSAVINYDNIRYEFTTSDEGCTLEELKTFLDSLES